RSQRGPVGRWRLEVSWTLPHSGPWAWRLEGAGSTVSLSLAVAPEVIRWLSEPWVPERLAGILQGAGLTPAAVSIRPLAGTPSFPGRSSDPWAAGGSDVSQPGGFDVRV